MEGSDDRHRDSRLDQAGIDRPLGAQTRRPHPVGARRALTYDPEAVERSVALSIGGERIFSRVRGKQWRKAAGILKLDTDLLTRRVATMAETFPGAFETALAEIADAPGTPEVAERTCPPFASTAPRFLHASTSDLDGNS